MVGGVKTYKITKLQTYKITKKLQIEQIQEHMSKKITQKPHDQADAVQKFQQQVEELENNWKRALADYKNLESRVERQRVDAVLFATSSLITRLLKILDDLDRARTHHHDEWIRLMRDEFFGILSVEGVTEIPARGLPFDPATMECVAQVTGEKDRVIKVLVKGYTLHGQILRHAKVEVGSGTADRNPESTTSSEETKDLNQ
jgi:molecular chaperone GrpE